MTFKEAMLVVLQLAHDGAETNRSKYGNTENDKEYSDAIIQIEDWVDFL